MVPHTGVNSLLLNHAFCGMFNITVGGRGPSSYLHRMVTPVNRSFTKWQT